MENVVWASLPLRLAVGIVFLLHGSQKAFGAFGGPGIAGFAKNLAGMGVPLAVAFAWIVMLVEFAGGLALILGLYTRLAASLIAADMLVAILKVHLPKGFFAASGGIEYAVVLFAACISLIILGGGKFSITPNF
jgi:putative oxidoreductase